MSKTAISQAFRELTNKKISPDAGESLLIAVERMFLKNMLHYHQETKKKTVDEGFRKVVGCPISNIGPFKMANVKRILREAGMRAPDSVKQSLLCYLNGLFLLLVHHANTVMDKKRKKVLKDHILMDAIQMM